MAEDGSIVFRVDADDKEAQKKLASLRKDMEKTTKALEKTNAQHNGISEALRDARKEAELTAKKIQETKGMISEGEKLISSAGKPGQVTSDDYNRVASVIAEQKAQLAEQEKTMARQQAEVGKLEGQEQKVLATLTQQTNQLEQQKRDAGAIESAIANQSRSALPNLKNAADQASVAINKGFKNILKWGFGIRSTFILIRRLKSYIKEAVSAFAEQDEETKANINSLKESLQMLKISWGAAFAPVLNAIVPLLQKLISWITSAANAVARFFAVLGGKNSYKKAVSGTNALAGGYEAAGDAAEEAKKQIMGFDEINQLNEDKANKSGNGGSGGGGAGGVETVDELIDQTSLAARLAFAVKDVFFDWSDLNAEQIAEKALAGLLGLGGMIIGGMIGGVPGAIIGLAAGLALGTLLDATIFNFDGQLSKTEFIRALIYAAGFVGGAGIGFLVGGPLGAMLGAGIGLFLSFSLDSTIFDAQGKVRPDAFKNVLKKIFSWNPTILLGPAGSSVWVYQTLKFIFNKFEFSPIEWAKAKLKSWFDKLKQYFQSYIDKWTESGSESGNKVGFNVVMGILDGMVSGVLDLVKDVYGKVIKPIIDAFKSALGIHSPSTVFEKEIGENIVAGLWEGIQNKWDQLVNGFRGKVDELKAAISQKVQSLKDVFNFEWSLPRPKLPHFRVDIEDYGIIKLPRVSVSWYKRGGIFDSPSLIGVGEAGKEAVMPLEHNTGWIRELAEQLLSAMDNKFSGALNGLPAMAMGGVVPPNAVPRGYSGGENSLLDEIKALRSEISVLASQPIEVRSNLYMDKRKVGESVTEYQRTSARASGR